MIEAKEENLQFFFRSLTPQKEGNEKERNSFFYILSLSKSDMSRNGKEHNIAKHIDRVYIMRLNKYDIIEEEGKKNE